MADERIVTSIVANSDFSNLIADVQRVTSSLFKLQQEFAGANRALSGQINATNTMFKETMLKTGQFSSHFVSLTSDVEKFGRNLDSGRLKLRDYFRVYQEHSRTSGGLIRDLARQQTQLENAVLQPLGRNAQGLMQYNVHIPRGLDLTKNKTSILKHELQIMNKVIQDGGIQLINWGKNTQWAGRQLTVGLTLPLVAFGKAAADAFKVADQELTRLAKVYGDIGGATAQELQVIRKEVSETARELSSAMGVGFTETIALAADIAATGKTGNELLSSVSETTRLAVLGEVDRQEAMKATLAIQTAFKQNTEELAESINFLNAVENQTSTSLNDLVEAIPKAGPVVKSLGGDIQDLALYITAMREGGINASESANALKSGLASLINPTKQTVGVMKDFGIDILGMVNKNAGDTTSLLFDLQKALDQLDPLQKAQAIEQMFGKFQFARISALLNNLGRQGSQTLQVLDLMGASAAELESVASRELSAVTESAAGRYRRAIESLKADLAGVGDEFLNIATKIINLLNKVVEFGQKLPDPIKKIIAFGGAFTAIIGPVIMLTGVLANFFGYIIKGVGHFKALFKGAEGFRLLTPEIIAARAASAQLSDEFYSDALAADTLRLAIKKLAEDLAILQRNATSATTATAGLGQVITTTAGTPISSAGGSGRVVDTSHVLLGQKSRAAAHMNPRDPQNPATIFGLTLQPIPVNRSIGRNPQILMEERLPNVEGLTTIGGVSTGVVAPEHARYQALMATLGLQSQKEIQELKKTIKFGGQVSSEFMATFDDILPITQELTANAARQSAAIVSELRAGKMSVQQARDAIIAVNAQLERDLGIRITAYGATQGRTIDLTKAPLIDQPIVDAAGKPNTRGMYRSGIFRKVMDAVGRATRTKTYGGPYSIETTRPIQRNTGGKVFYNNGDQVPGPNVNADVVPAMLTPGEFVIRRDVAQQDPEGMRALNAGEAVVVPVQNKFAGGPIQRILASIGRWNPNFARGARRVYETSASNSPRTFDPAVAAGPTPYHSLFRRSSKSWEEHGGLLKLGERKPGEVLGHVITSKFLKQFKGFRRQGSSAVLPGSEFEKRFGTMPGGATATKEYQVLPDNIVNITEDFNKALLSGSARGIDWLSSNRQPQHFISLISHLLNSGVPYNVAHRVAGRTLDRINKAMVNLKDVRLTETKWGNIVDDAMSREMQALTSSYKKAAQYSFNRGGKVPGYSNGGGISRAGMLAKLGAKFKYEGKTYEGRDAFQTYRIKAMDINGGRKYFGDIPGLSDKARGALYNSTLEYFNSTLIKGERINGKRLFDNRSFIGAMPVIAHSALLHNKNWLGPEDTAILQSISGKGGSLYGSVGSASMLSKVKQKVFKANKGGSVPGYNRGGSVYGYASGVQNKILGGSILRMLGPLALMFGGQKLGEKVGGGAGQAISSASWLLPMFMGGMNRGRPAPTVGQRLGFSQNESALSPMRQSVFAQTTPVLGKFATSLGNAATSGGKLSSSIAKVLIGVSRFAGVFGVATAGISAGIAVYKNYQRTQELSAAQFGMTAESAEKAGLKFTDFNAKVKELIQSQKLLLNQNKLTYQSMASAGTPFKMTIAEYKELKKEVKETMSTQLEMLNTIKNADVKRVAVQLKEQFVAMGLSAEEANKRVYALLQMSNKSQFTISAMSAKPFTDIIDAQTAAVSALKTFNYAKQFENTRDQAAQLNTALTAINASISEIFNKAEQAAKKKNEDFNSTKALYESEKKALDELNSKVVNQRKLGADVLKNLEKQNPLISKMVTAQDTVVSMWQKMQIAARGYTGDLSNLTVVQTQRLYDAQIEVSLAVEKAAQAKGGMLEKEYDAYEKLRGQQKSLEQAQKGQSVRAQINTREELKALDAKIKKINQEADARKKALREEAQAEDVALRVQQQRLEYEKMVSAGDFTGAAEARLELQRLLNEQQTTIAEQQIEEKRIRDVRPFERRRNEIQEGQQKLSDRASLAAESLESVNKRLEKQKSNIDAVNDAYSDFLIAEATGEGIKGAAARLIKALRDAGQKIDEEYYASADDARAGKKTSRDPVTLARDLADKFGSQINNILANKDMSITANGDIIIGGKKLTAGKEKSDGSFLVTPQGATTTMEVKKTEGKTLREAGAEAQSGKRQTRVFVTETNKQGYDIFEWKGKTYAIDKQNNVIYHFDEKKNELGARAKYASGGLLRGPGTGTSDSILGMYSNGGMVRVSNGEYIINAETVKNIGVPFFDAINGMKNGGLMVNYSVPRYGNGGELTALTAYQPSGAFNVNNNITINASEGMNVDDLVNKVAAQVETATARALSKVGPERNISRRY